jgi:hypothetical protein
MRLLFRSPELYTHAARLSELWATARLTRLVIGISMKSNPLYRHRRGSVIVVLIGGLVFVTIFFTTYCFKQWQVNRGAAQIRTARPAQQKQNPSLVYHWPSPDGRLAFKPPPLFSWGRRTSQLVDHETGRVLYDSNFAGRIACRWRADSKACAVEHKPRSGRNEVVLLLIEGDQVTSCRPADVIEPDRFLPDGDWQLPVQWEHSVGALSFWEDGNLQVDWVGTARLTRPGRPVQVIRVVRQFKIGYTPDGDVFLVESFR